MYILNKFNILNKVIALITDNESAMLVCRREIASPFNNEFLSMIFFSHYHYTAYILNLDIK